MERKTGITQIKLGGKNVDAFLLRNGIDFVAKRSDGTYVIGESSNNHVQTFLGTVEIGFSHTENGAEVTLDCKQASALQGTRNRRGERRVSISTLKGSPCHSSGRQQIRNGVEVIVAPTVFQAK